MLRAKLAVRRTHSEHVDALEPSTIDAPALDDADVDAFFAPRTCGP